MRPYILMAKQSKNGSLCCERCGNREGKDLHHKVYGGRITIDDLELLCEQCHLDIPTVRSVDGIVD
jgi:5-methylcytosine-specific restriction endonuclease McrA